MKEEFDLLETIKKLNKLRQKEVRLSSINNKIILSILKFLQDNSIRVELYNESYHVILSNNDNKFFELHKLGISNECWTYKISDISNFTISSHNNILTINMVLKELN